MPLFCPSCPLSRGSSHVVAVLTDWCQICLLMISSNTHCQLQCIPWLGLVLFQLVWWTPLFRQQSLLIILSHIVGHSSKLCWKNNMNSLLRAKLGEQVSLAIRLLYLAVGIFSFFNACWMKLVMKTNICCTTSPAFLSLVLRLFTQICTRSRFSVRVLV